MTQTLFSLVLAIALWLRASKHPVAAALLVSLLPLARLEGLFVVAVWAVFLLLERRYRAIPALATGTAAWAIVGAITYRDPLWLWHANPYGILGSQYPTAGWSYIFYALPIAFGPVAGGLAIAALARRRLGDPMIGALALGLPLFYAFAWGAPAFQSFPDPVYLVSASVPIALCAHGCLASLLEPGTAEPRGRLASFAGSAAALMLVARLVAVNRGNPSISLFFLLLVVSGVVAWNIGLSLAGRPAMRSLERAAAIGLLGLAAATGLFRTTPLRLEREESLSKQAVDHLGERAADVVLWQDPAFGWYAGRDSMAPVIPLQQVPVGGLVELDSHHVDVKDPARLTTLGFQPVWAVQNHDAKLVLYRRVAPPVLAH